MGAPDTSHTFFVFWAIFFVMTAYFSILTGYGIFKNTEGFEDLIGGELSGWDFINPLTIFNIFFALFNVTSDLTVITAMIIVPFIVGGVISFIFFIWK